MSNKLSGRHARRPGSRVQRRQCLIDALEPRRFLSTTYYVDPFVTSPTYTGSSWSAAYANLDSQNTVSATAGTYSDHIVVSWSPVSGASDYKVVRNDGRVFGWLGADATSWTDAAGAGDPANVVTPGVHYTYTVVAAFGAMDINGGTDYSDQRTVGTAVGYENDASATAGTYPDHIVVSWSPVPGASDYKVVRNDGRVFGWLGQDATSWADATGAGDPANVVTPGLPYTYSVVAAYGNKDVNDGTDYSNQQRIGTAVGYENAPSVDILYVDLNAPGANDGSSWSDAFTSLSTALAQAVPGQLVLVADGTYKPTTTSIRTLSFNLKTGVALYGSFAGYGAADPNARDLTDYPTTLSGDIGTAGDTSDNSYHVVVGSGTDATAVLDGFTITAGNANGSGNQRYGGGMLDLSGNPTLTDCTFIANSASSDGGGMYNSFSSPTLANCTFSGNSATNDGGGMENYGSSIPILTNCTFAANSASAGGGMFNYSSSSPTLTNCTFTGNSANAGGGMENYYSSPTLANCTFIGNSASYGGGMRNTSFSPTLTNCTFIGNSATNDGGGMYNDHSSSPALSNCAFANNSSTNGNGGGIYDDFASPCLVDCTLSANSAFQDGGAVYNFSSSPSYSNCVFTQNSVGHHGGGMYNTASSDPSIINTIFDGNAAPSGYGGGLYNYQSSPSVVNCAFTGNSAGFHGGGLYNYQSAATLTNCTIAANVVTHNGGGIYDDESQPTLTNCIIWGNAAGELGPQLYDNVLTAHIAYSDVQGGYAGTGNLDLDPLFFRNPDPGTDSVWGTGDDDYGNLRLAIGSPCVDAGNTTALPTDVTTDLAGKERRVDFPGVHDPGAIVDMGAYERPFIVYVDPNATGANDGSSWADAFTSMAAALAQARPGQSLHVADGTYLPTTTTDRMVSFQLKSGVTLYGGYAGLGAPDPDARDVAAYPTILSGDIGVTGSNSDNSYHVVAGSGTDATAVLDGFTITAGNSNGNGQVVFVDQAGGGMVNSGGSPTINNCVFSGNAASVEGGAIANAANAFPTITNCTFSGNTASSGGVIYDHYSSPSISNCTFRDNNGTYDCGGIDNYASSPSISNCTFSGNVAYSGYGGAIYNYYHSSPTITNCTFSSNHASLRGGAIYDYDSSPSISNCTFSGNNSPYGGAIANYYNSSPTIIDCTLSKNIAGNGGAIYNSSSSPTITGCTFTRNAATSYGGAIRNYESASPTIDNCMFNVNTAFYGAFMASYNSSPILLNCTLSGNFAKAFGGGLYNDHSAAMLINCVLWGNVANSADSEIYNDSSTPSVTYSDVQGGYAGTGNLDSDPLFDRNPSPGPDGNWGTVDDDYGDLRLLPNSPCLDAGSNAALPAGTTTDLAGHPRVTDFPGAGPADTAVVDMGVYEASTDLGDLHITPGQTVTLPAGGYAFTATRLIVDPGGTLDLADDSLLITYAGPSPLPAVRAALASGYHNGTWTGTGITSSAARTVPHRAVGYAEAASLGLTTFAGRPIDGPALLLKYTLAGDATLDGRLNADDFALADRGRARGTFDNWVHGDFNYDAAVTDADLALLTAAFAPPPTPAPVATTATAPDEQPAVVPVTAAVLSTDNPAPAPAAQTATPAIPPHHARHTPKAKHHLAKAKQPKHPHLIQSKHKKAKSSPHAAIHHKHASRAAHSSHPHSAR